MISEERKAQLFRQGYRIVGNHSAVKICLYCKKAIRGEDVCYKSVFYGIKSWRCVQMTPILDVCNLRCSWCWRNLRYTNIRFEGKFDKASDVVDGCIEEQRKLLMGFKGMPENIDKKRVEEAMNPKHFAISLTSEISLYPGLPELIDEIKKRGMTAFFVTNGTNPDMLRKLKRHAPTQLYITVPAPDEKTFKKVCKPLSEGLWEKILESLEILGDFKRGTVRLTLAKDMNFFNPRGYGRLLSRYSFDFLEVKAAMPVGYAQYRMRYSQMPWHEEIVEFGRKIGKETGLKITSQKRESRVVLLTGERSVERMLRI